MKYDFETKLDRTGQGSSKWMKMKNDYPEVEEGIVPLSVADMEFKNAPEIIKGLKNYLNDCVLGYAQGNQSFFDAVISWQKRRHNWEVKQEWIVNTPGIVSALFSAVRAFTEPGDGVIVFKPVYYPFSIAIDINDRVEVNVPLINTDDYYTIDFDAFDQAAADPKNKLLIFCSPHNPIGRVWKPEELKTLGEIAVKHNLIVVSDEIWNDLIMPGYKHTVITNACPELMDNVIICSAPSKTFNLAGLMTSNIVIPNESLRDKFRFSANSTHGTSVPILGYKACEIAYNEAEPWLEELLPLLDKNQRVVADFFAKRFPKITCPLIEGTYLLWLNFKCLGLSKDELEEMNVKKAQFFTDEGYLFGEEGIGYERINIAAPTAVLLEALERLGSVLDEVYEK